jgi:hypothetical protein
MCAGLVLLLTSVRPSIWTDISQLHHIFGLQTLHKVDESGTFNLPNWQENDSDSCGSNGRELVEHTDNIDAPGRGDLSICAGG